MKTIEAITASPNPGVKTLTGEQWAVALTITEHKAAQVERANASSATSSFTGSGCCPERRDSVIRSESSFAAAVFMFLNFVSGLNDITT